MIGGEPSKRAPQQRRKGVYEYGGLRTRTATEVHRLVYTKMISCAMHVCFQSPFETPSDFRILFACKSG